MESIYNPNYYYSFAIDLTNRCNGKCMFCPRHCGFTKKMDTLSELDFDTFKRTFNSHYLNHITNLVINGNLGEPTFYSKLFDLIDYVSSINKKVKIFISTNGSIRPVWWWRKLAEKMVYNQWNMIRFTLDGLEDTHHIYRGTDYHTVVRNLMTYIESGGRAEWQYIVFKHNQHQIELAKKIARDIGCTNFITVISRHYKDHLERPDNIEAETKNELCLQSRERLFCTPIENRHLYISHEGVLYPCCDYGLFEDFRKIERYPGRMYIEYLRSLESIDLSRSTISDALNSSFFRYVFENKENLIRCQTGCKIKNNNCNERIQKRNSLN